MRASLYGGRGLLDRFGAERVLDLPTSETASVGTGVGAAMTGLRPVVDMTFACFTFVAMDQFVSQVAKARYVSGGALTLPVTYRILFIYDAGVGVQHSDRPHPMYMSVPGLKIVAPSTPADAKGLLKSAIRDDDPVLVVENLPIYKEKGDVPLDPEFLVPIGRAAVPRTGSDITLVSHSFATVRALHVAESLQRDHGVSAEVVDLRSLRPLDVETVAASVAKTSRAVCIEEGWPTYGVSAELAARIQRVCFDDLDAPVERVGMAEVPLPYAKELETAALPGEDRIEAAVLATLGLAR